MKSIKYLKLNIALGMDTEQQQQPNLFPLNGVDYIDQATPKCPLMYQV